MKLRKLLAASCVAMVLAAGLSTTALAAQPTDITPPTAGTYKVNPPDEPQIDQIETKFRTTVDGRIQYRRWNATRGYWVDPYWIDLPTP